jgi:hypothetical protein
MVLKVVNGEGGESMGRRLDEGRGRGGDSTSVCGRRCTAACGATTAAARCWRWETALAGPEWPSETGRLWVRKEKDQVAAD